MGARPLDLRALRLAADPFVGEHDFASFCRKGPEGSSTTRRVLESRWVDEGDGVLRYEIRGNAFCWQLVRSIVGTLVEVGLGKRRPGEMMGIIRAADRGAAGQLAPAAWPVPLGGRLLTPAGDGRSAASVAGRRDAGIVTGVDGGTKSLGLELPDLRRQESRSPTCPGRSARS